MDQYDVKDSARLATTVKSCVGRIGRTTSNKEIADWTEALLKEGHPVRFGRMVFEVIDSLGRYYAGDGEEARHGGLWDRLRCRQTVSLLAADEHGNSFLDVRKFAERAVKTWNADWGASPPSQLLEV